MGIHSQQMYRLHGIQRQFRMMFDCMKSFVVAHMSRTDYQLFLDCKHMYSKMYHNDNEHFHRRLVDTMAMK